MKKIVFGMLAISALAVSASAQQVSSYTFERKSSADAAPQVLLDKVRAEQAQVALQTKTIPNAPYSAEATNESVQLLPDGNRIVKRSVTRVYRDSVGRIRRETLDDNGQITLVTVSDPTTGTSYVSDPRNNTVSHSQSMVRMRATPAQGGTVTAQGTGTGSSTAFVYSTDKQPVESGQMLARSAAVGGVAGGTFVYATGLPAKGETTKEELGQQAIEGVMATGTRTTTVIPAGAIGNEQPIKIVSEQWFSDDLQVLVLTKHSDPRSGDTIYRLSGINRTEPAKALFEPPAGK